MRLPRGTGSRDKKDIVIFILMPRIHSLTGVCGALVKSNVWCSETFAVEGRWRADVYFALRRTVLMRFMEVAFASSIATKT